MKRRAGILLAVGVLVLGATAWAGTVDFSGNWAGVTSGATMSVYQHGDSFRVVMHNAEGGNFKMHFVANGQEQQLRTKGAMRQMVTASWQGSDLLINSRVLANSKVRRHVSLQISMGEDGQLHVAVTRGNGQHQRTRNLVLQRQ